MVASSLNVTMVSFRVELGRVELGIVTFKNNDCKQLFKIVHAKRSVQMVAMVVQISFVLVARNRQLKIKTI